MENTKLIPRFVLLRLKKGKGHGLCEIFDESFMELEEEGWLIYRGEYEIEEDAIEVLKSIFAVQVSKKNEEKVFVPPAIIIRPDRVQIFPLFGKTPQKDRFRKVQVKNTILGLKTILSMTNSAMSGAIMPKKGIILLPFNKDVPDCKFCKTVGRAIDYLIEWEWNLFVGEYKYDHSTMQELKIYYPGDAGPLLAILPNCIKVIPLDDFEKWGIDEKKNEENAKQFAITLCAAFSSL